MEEIEPPVSDTEYRRELGLLSKDELVKDSEGYIEDEGISWNEAFPESVEDAKGDTVSEQTQQEKADVIEKVEKAVIENARDVSEDSESRKKAPVVRRIRFEDDTGSVSDGESTVNNAAAKEAAKEAAREPARSSETGRVTESISEGEIKREALPETKNASESTVKKADVPANERANTKTNEAAVKSSTENVSKKNAMVEEKTANVSEKAVEKPTEKAAVDASVADDSKAIGDVSTSSVSAENSKNTRINAIKEAAVSPNEALKGQGRSNAYSDEVYRDLTKKSVKAAEALSGALGVNIKIFSDTAGIGNFYDSASDTLYINGDGEFPVSYQLRRGLMTMLASSDSAGFAKLRDFLVGKYIEMFGKDAYTEYAEKKKKVFAEDGLSLDDIGVGNELCADLGVFMLSDADTAKAIAKELRTPEAKKLLRALEMLSKTEGVNFDFLPTAVESLGEADMQAAEKMVLDMFFRDGVGKDRKNSYVVAENTSGTDVAKGIFDETTATKRNPATKEEIDSYIDYSLEYASVTKEKGNVTFPKQREAIDYGEASERMVDDLKNDVDVTGKRHVLRDNDFRHIVNSHGENTNEKYPITASDLKQIPDIVENYDDVLFVPHPNGNKGIYYVKQHNGITYYLEAIAQNDALIGKQMIKVPTGTVPDIRGLSEAINKKWSAYSRQMNKIPRMYVQDASHTAPFVNSIPENNGVNNAENVNNLQNKANSAAVKTDVEPEVTAKTDVQAKSKAKTEAKPEETPKADAEVMVQAKPEVESEIKTEVEAEIKAKTKPEVESKIDTEAKHEAKPEAKSDYVFADLPAHMVVKSKNTKTGETIYVLKLKKYVSPDDYKAINAQVKAKGGYYSRYAQGFIAPKEIFDAYNAEALSKLYKADFYLLKDLDGEDNFTKESGYGIELSAKDGTPMTFYLLEEDGQWIPVEASTGMLCGYERPTLPEAIQQLTPEFLQEIKSDYLTKDEQKQAAEKLAKLKEAVDNKIDVGYNEAGNVKETSAQAVPEKSEQLINVKTENVKDVKNGKEGTEDVQGRGILDGESGHDGGRLRRETTGSDDGNGNSQDVSEAREDGGRVLQGDSIDQASGRDGGNDGEGANGSDVRGSDHGEVKESSSARGRRGDLGRADSGHVRLVSEQPLTEESGADTEAASDVSSAGKKAAKTVEDEKKAVKKVQT